MESVKFSRRPVISYDKNTFLTKYGLDSGQKILTAVKTFLKEKYNVNDITFIELYNKFKGNKEAVITSATPLEEKIQLQIVKKVKESSFSGIKIINKIDETIGGGYILKIGDILFDESLSKKFEKLKRELTLNNYSK